MADLRVTVSEETFGALFRVLRDAVSLEASATPIKAGLYTIGYHVKAHLEGGTLDLRPDNSAEINELEIKWDILKLVISVNLEQRCVGGYCVVWTPAGCAVSFPKKCVFGKNPDIVVTLDLSQMLTSELSVTVAPMAEYIVNPAKTPSMSDIDAQDAGVANSWKLYVHPVNFDADVLDIPDIVGDLLDKAIEEAVNDVLGPLPDWVKTLILTALGPVTDVVRDVLDIPDDVQEWVSHYFNEAFNIIYGLFIPAFSLVLQKKAVHEIEDPYPVLPASDGLIPVKIPMKTLEVRFTEHDMIVEANVGT